MNYISIDKQSKASLYQQLAESIEHAIAQQILLPEQRLPSEEVLCETFGISRSVVKLAYAQLEEKKLIVRNPKGGTYVAFSNRYQNIMNDAPFFIDVLMKSSFKWRLVVNLDEINGTEKHIKYTIFIDEIPMCLTDIWFQEYIDFYPNQAMKTSLGKLSKSTEFKVSIVNKQTAQFFNQSTSMAVCYFHSSFFINEVMVVRLEQRVSPLMGELIFEVTNEI